ncbi:MAG: amidohydrolase family protein [Fimbriimonadaceae bacterium]|nr:amidohydrolase family protein [Fimbriimonadaceae bacterium]
MKYIADFLGPSGFGTYEVDWSTSVPSFERVSRPPELLLVPGFVDIHIHGAFGIDFMSATQADLLTLCRRLEGCGYEAFLPTTVTAPASDVQRAIDQLPDDPLIGGFHLEGPFLSPDFPGAQPPEAIIDPPVAPGEWDAILDHPKLKVVTLAPERPNALDLIRRLTSRDVRVGMGHTNATYDEARHGYEFGATHTTHTFNAMRGFHHREAGAVGYALANRDLMSELIYDRSHVSKEAAALLLSVKPEDNVVAVSDSTMASGMPPGQYIEMWGHRCETTRGEVRLADSGALAGSAITLLDAFRNIADDFGTETAVRLCCLNPRKLLGWKGRARAYIEMSLDYEILDRRIRERV